jgi:hypothetical protein
VKPVDRVGRIVLEDTEIDDEVDRRLIGPDVAAPIDAGLDDPQVGRDRAGRGGGPSVMSAPGHRRRALRWRIPWHTPPA